MSPKVISNCTNYPTDPTDPTDPKVSCLVLHLSRTSNSPNCSKRPIDTIHNACITFYCPRPGQVGSQCSVGARVVLHRDKRRDKKVKLRVMSSIEDECDDQRGGKSEESMTS